MSLFWTSPGLLWGLVLLGLPVLAHLTARREGPLRDFPTLRFLVAAQKRVRRRTRLQHLLLLFLRCLAVGAVVAAFAQPKLLYESEMVPGEQGLQDVVVVLDTSMSMTYADGRWDGAVEAARRLIEGLEPGRGGALVTMDGRARLLPPGFSREPASLLPVLEEIEPGWGTTDLARAVRLAVRVLDDSALGTGSVHIIGDGTSTVLPGDAADWADRITVHYWDVSVEEEDNHWVEDVVVDVGARRADGGTVIAELGSVGGQVGERRLTLQVGGAAPSLATFSGEGEGLTEKRFSLAVVPPGSVPGRLEIEADSLAADDTHTFHMETDQPLTAWLVGGETGRSIREQETWLLESALRPRGGADDTGVIPEVVPIGRLGLLDPDADQGLALFLANLQDLGPVSERVEAFVRAGGGVFLSLGGRVDPDSWNQHLDWLPARIDGLVERSADTFDQAPTTLGIPGTEHPLLRPFREGGREVFGAARFGRYHAAQPAPDAEVLLRYADGLPALIERRVGLGRVLLFTSTVDTDWCDLPIRTVFVPLTHQLVRYLAGALDTDRPGQAVVGEAIEVPAPSDGGGWVRSPDGEDWPLPIGGNSEGRERFRETTRIGDYEVWHHPERGEPELAWRFSVNPDPVESRLEAIERLELAEILPGLVWHALRSDRDVDDEGRDKALVQRRLPLEGYLMLLALMLLLAEGLLANQRGSVQATREEGT